MPWVQIFKLLIGRVSSVKFGPLISGEIPVQAILRSVKPEPPRTKGSNTWKESSIPGEIK